MTETNKLNSRQWKLYNLLKEHPDRWLTQKEICERIPEYIYKDRNNDRCPKIRDDKIVINASFETDKIIVMKKYCFKIGTPEEYKQERNMHIRRLNNQLKEIRSMDHKYGRDGQGKILSNRGDVIDESSRARDYYETFFPEID